MTQDYDKPAVEYFSKPQDFDKPSPMFFRKQGNQWTQVDDPDPLEKHTSMAELSPAAQTVLSATDNMFYQTQEQIAAALEALADQVAPLSTNTRQNDIRFSILRIAAELRDAVR